MCIFPEKRCGETLAVDTVPHNVDQNHVYDSRFYRVEDPAGDLMLPYLLWATYAAYLNMGVFLLN